jgi:hypothetical protein
MAIGLQAEDDNASRKNPATKWIRRSGSSIDRLPVEIKDESISPVTGGDLPATLLTPASKN